MIELKHLQFRYKKRKALFNDLSLTLDPGFIYGLLGKNGAGKTTLLKHIAGLLFQQSGECLVFGIESRERLPQMLQDFYMVPEEFELPAISIRNYVNITSPFYPNFSGEQFYGYLKEFELSDDQKLSTLSYGQKKKFLIAFGLATNCRLLVLDEPTNGLDIPSKSQFRKIIAGALSEEKIVVISTHQVRDLENMIDVVLILEDGKIVFNKNIAEISEKLAFEENLNGVEANEILYSEEMPGRKSGIVRNFSGFDSKVDLELLFNAVVKNPELLNRQFNETSAVSEQ